MPISALQKFARRVSKKMKPKSLKSKAAGAKLGGYIAPRRPVSSGGEGASVSTYTPASAPISSGGEGGGGGGGYVYTGGSISSGGE